jgi:hypothetical protein
LIYLHQELLEPRQMKADVLLSFQSGGLFPYRKLLQPKLTVGNKAEGILSHFGRRGHFGFRGLPSTEGDNEHTSDLQKRNK